MEAFLVSTGIIAFTENCSKNRYFVNADTAIHNLPYQKHHSVRSNNQQSICRRKIMGANL